MKGIDIKLLEACGATFILNQKIRPSINGFVYKAEMYFNKEFYDATITRFWFGGGTLLALRTKDGKNVLSEVFDKIEDIVSTDMKQHSILQERQMKLSIAEAITKKTTLCIIFSIDTLIAAILALVFIFAEDNLRTGMVKALLFGMTAIISKVLELKVRAYGYQKGDKYETDLRS